mmetsp:Transcript_11716/g.30544  ORF Transcript_11716/g.30544 Transcript_11716/m.30544 type:complete len:244 (+) Transcript_11716:338-1069(+)
MPPMPISTPRAAFATPRATPLPTSPGGGCTGAASIASSCSAWLATACSSASPLGRPTSPETLLPLLPSRRARRASTARSSCPSWPPSSAAALSYARRHSTCAGCSLGHTSACSMNCAASLNTSRSVATVATPYRAPSASTAERAKPGSAEGSASSSRERRQKRSAGSRLPSGSLSRVSALLRSTRIRVRACPLCTLSSSMRTASAGALLLASTPSASTRPEAGMRTQTRTPSSSTGHWRCASR